MLYPIESSFSPEVIAVTSIAGPVASLTATPGFGQFVLTWPQLVADVFSYRIYYKTTYSDDYHGTGLTLGGNSAPSPITVLVSSLVDPANPSITLANVTPTQPYWLKIVAVDNLENESVTPTTLASNRNVTTSSTGGGGGALAAAPINVVVLVDQPTKAITLNWE